MKDLLKFYQPFSFNIQFAVVGEYFPLPMFFILPILTHYVRHLPEHTSNIWQLDFLCFRFSVGKLVNKKAEVEQEQFVPPMASAEDNKKLQDLLDKKGIRMTPNGPVKTDPGQSEHAIKAAPQPGADTPNQPKEGDAPKAGNGEVK
jgi:hypothetical protein